MESVTIGYLYYIPNTSRFYVASHLGLAKVLGTALCRMLLRVITVWEPPRALQARHSQINQELRLGYNPLMIYFPTYDQMAHILPI